jgi:tetratricopeptide (TPR) repeat protein
VRKALFSSAISLLICAWLHAAYGDPSAEALMEAGHWKRARAAVEALAQRQPNDAETAYLQSRIKLAFGDAAAAQKLAEAAVAKDDKTARYHYQLAEACVAQTENAGMFKALSMSRCARREWEAAIALDPKYLDPRESLAEFYTQAPGIAGGDKGKARAMAEEIGAIAPARGHLARARIAQAEKQTDKAAASYQEAMKADPHGYNTLVAAAFFFANLRQPNCEVAGNYARQASVLDPGRVDSYVVLALCAAHGQQWAALDAVLVQAVQKCPDDFSPFYQAGKALLLDGHDLARAEGYFRKYLTQEPEGSTPDLAAAHWRLALVLEKEGRKPEAIAELQASLKIRPDFEDAKKDLKRLR